MQEMTTYMGFYVLQLIRPRCVLQRHSRRTRMLFKWGLHAAAGMCMTARSLNTCLPAKAPACRGLLGRARVHGGVPSHACRIQVGR